MTTAFYAPPDAFQGNIVELPADEARHAAQSLRKEAGDEIIVVDGAGGWHRVEVTGSDGSRVSGRVVESRREVGEPDYRLTVGLALLKKKSRFETFLEKAVELGVHRVVPLHTRHTVKRGFRRKRAEKILIAAMKQCGRSRLVELEEPHELSAALREDPSGLSLVCHEALEDPYMLRTAVGDHPYETHISAWIGPEGGFHPEEVIQARDAGAHVVSLGPRRLRAETAAIAAAAGIMTLKGIAEPATNDQP